VFTSKVAIDLNQIQDGGICLATDVTKCNLKMMIGISVPIVQILLREQHLGNTIDFPAVIFVLLNILLIN
jgi:hypothetical protein